MDEEKLKATEQDYFTKRQEELKKSLGIDASGIAGMTIANQKAVEPHPREFLERIITQQEQRLLDELAALREARELYRSMSRDEAGLCLKQIRIGERIESIRRGGYPE